MSKSTQYKERCAHYWVAGAVVGLAISVVGPSLFEQAAAPDGECVAIGSDKEVYRIAEPTEEVNKKTFVRHVMPVVTDEECRLSSSAVYEGGYERVEGDVIRNRADYHITEDQTDLLKVFGANTLPKYDEAQDIGQNNAYLDKYQPRADDTVIINFQDTDDALGRTHGLQEYQPK